MQLLAFGPVQDEQFEKHLKQVFPEVKVGKAEIEQLVKQEVSYLYNPASHVIQSVAAGPPHESQLEWQSLQFYPDV